MAFAERPSEIPVRLLKAQNHTMKNCAIYLIFFALISCNSSPVFNFDSVNLYQIKTDKDCNDEMFCALLNENNLPDTSLTRIESEVNKFYTKKELNKKTVAGLQNIYANGMQFELSEKKCLPIYQDILVFRNKNVITGVSKICFECDMSYSIDKDGREIQISSNKIEELHSLLK